MKSRSRGAYVRWWILRNPPSPWPPGFGPNAATAPPEQFVFGFARKARGIQLQFGFVLELEKEGKSNG